MAVGNPVAAGDFMLSSGFAYWVSIGSSAACSNNTINFAPFGRRTWADAHAGYHGALGGKAARMASKKNSIQPVHWYGLLEVADFEMEVSTANSLIKSFIDLVKSGSSELPGREELARACLCLILSTEEVDQLEESMDLVRQLEDHEVGLSLYSIRPNVEKLYERARASRENIARISYTRIDDSDIPF